MKENNPFDYIMNIGSSKEGFLLVAAPFVLVCIFAAFFTIYALKKRKNVAKGLDTVIEDLSSKNESAQSAAPMNQSETESDVDKIRKLNKEGWLTKLRDGLSKTTNALNENLASLFSGKTKIDENILEKLHETLYRADIGTNASDLLVNAVRTKLAKNESTNWESVKTVLKDEVFQILSKPANPIAQPPSGPLVIMIVGVNGVGKTTTIGKLAAHYLAQDKSVLLCAGDTFRAAAIDQLKVWGERVGAHVVAHQQGSDPAATAFDAVKAAKARNIDVLIIDTAGRLHNKSDLMDELAKVSRIIKREIPDAPHETWLVIDSTTGQNGAIQVKAFKEVANLSGIVMTKLDGTAKGGIIISITEQFDVPVRFIGVGEKVNDLRTFDAKDFADTLFS